MAGRGTVERVEQIGLWRVLSGRGWTMYCDRCGAQLTPGGQYCTRCGKAIVGAERWLLRLVQGWGRRPDQRGLTGGCGGICGLWRRFGRLTVSCGWREPVR